LLHGRDTLASSTSSTVNEAKEFMNNLIIVFNNTGGLFNYPNGVIVQVMNTDSTFTDIEDFRLTRGSGSNSNIYTYTFPREIAGNAVLNDLKLQHAPHDSIVLIFRNPDIPLDTIRLAIPFVSISMRLYGQAGNPFGTPPLTPFPAASTGTAITMVAGEERDIFAKLFDADNNWLSEYENVDSLKSMITWTVNGTATVTPAVGNTTKFRATAAHITYLVTGTHTLHGFKTPASVLIKVDPAAPKGLDIVDNIEKIDLNNKTDLGEITIEKDKPPIKLWAVERDEFGNFVRIAQDPVWEVKDGDTRVNITTGSDGSVLIDRGKGAGNEIQVTVKDRAGVLDGDQAPVVVIGDLAVVAGPVPFIPGKSTIGELPQQVRTYYKDIIDANGGEGKSGVLIAVESPRVIKSGALRVVIYDAVGNVVLRTTTKGKVADTPTYGFIWDGKNNRGRAVGPGTYLVKMSGVQEDNGVKFQPPPKKIGVAK